ncbi:hypothetical protein [Pseudofrankia inefficax]|uniref:hypothetical protein n=1 Tax=Pseudofrankia inefficax (strain DSM 45817 / CECT 9037 / DDB 130130 / EuI1c) TaxID=298654 RepID=UPI0012FE4DC2|nr:hypothetical protein [Pseudofrankia inefficax]
MGTPAYNEELDVLLADAGATGDQLHERLCSTFDGDGALALRAKAKAGEVCYLAVVRKVEQPPPCCLGKLQTNTKARRRLCATRSLNVATECATESKARQSRYRDSPDSPAGACAGGP